MPCAMRPPVFLFVLPKRKTAPRPVEERKGRFHAGFPMTSVEPVPADIRAFPKTGCNRGTGCRLCFRAETLRLALRGACGTFCAQSSHRSPGNPTGVRRPPWPFQLGRFSGGGRKRNLPLLSAASFATFLRASEEKLIDAGHVLHPGRRKRIATPVCALVRNDVQRGRLGDGLFSHPI